MWKKSLKCKVKLKYDESYFGAKIMRGKRGRIRYNAEIQKQDLHKILAQNW